MALQLMILLPPKLWETHCQTPAPPRIKTILKIKILSIRTRDRLHQDPYLKTEKRKREPVRIPIIDTTRKSGPYSEAEKLKSELENFLSQCIQNT
jgi:hypothetical protein